MATIAERIELARSELKPGFTELPTDHLLNLLDVNAGKKFGRALKDAHKWWKDLNKQKAGIDFMMKNMKQMGIQNPQQFILHLISAQRAGEQLGKMKPQR